MKIINAVNHGDTASTAKPRQYSLFFAVLAVSPWLTIFSLPLGGCGTRTARPAAEVSVPSASTSRVATKKIPGNAGLKRGGGFYKDDGPGDNIPENIDNIADAVPKTEPLHRFANNPYSVLGRDYVPLRAITPFEQRGIASWYGKKFHGQKTSSGEIYDMYGMTAAHPTLPIPSYVRVTNPANGESVVVRINDRGPFHAGRIIDLSWTAAYKLGYLGEGSTPVEVAIVMPGQVMPGKSPPPVHITAENPPDAIARLLTEADAPPRPLPQSRDARGHFLQLGAFGNRDNAEALRAHLAREIGELGDKLIIQSTGPMHRVQLGPFIDSAEARAASEKLRESLGLAPVVVQR